VRPGGSCRSGPSARHAGSPTAPAPWRSRRNIPSTTPPAMAAASDPHPVTVELSDHAVAVFGGTTASTAAAALPRIFTSSCPSPRARLGPVRSPAPPPGPGPGRRVSGRCSAPLHFTAEVIERGAWLGIGFQLLQLQLKLQRLRGIMGPGSGAGTLALVSASLPGRLQDRSGYGPGPSSPRIHEQELFLNTYAARAHHPSMAEPNASHSTGSRSPPCFPVQQVTVRPTVGPVTAETSGPVRADSAPASMDHPASGSAPSRRVTENARRAA
jgi:hypothetical protein